MKVSQKLFATACAVLLVAIATPAQAYVIGVAINPTTGAAVGSQAGGDISFYALLNGEGTYGVGSNATNGLVADTCRRTTSSSTNTCTGGTLNMWLRFAPVTLGANVLTLAFTDLDLRGVNDPSYFLESVRIFDYSGLVRTEVAFVDHEDDPEVVRANDTYQRLDLDVDVDNNPYYVQLVLGTIFRSNAPTGTYTNTRESLRATMTSVSVPEPATLSMLGAGLLLIGFATRRHTKRRTRPRPTGTAQP